jgi:hypothetical protein
MRNRARAAAPSEHRFVWEALRTNIVAAEGETVSCPHRTWSIDADSPYCRDCMKAGIVRLIEDGARDDEVIGALAVYPIPERRWIETTLVRLRESNRPPGRPRLREAQVRDELETAMRRLRARGLIGPPTIEQLAQETGLGVEPVTITRRRERFPQLFREIAGLD